MTWCQKRPIATISLLLFISACSGVGGDVQAGRNALQTGRPNDAVSYLVRAADTDPNYKIPYRIRAGVLGYLGRAYLETGKDHEARQTLERAVTLDKDDPFAHLYLGIALIRTGERERGRKEINEGLRAIYDTLEYIAQDRVLGYFWDLGMDIRNDIRKTSAAKLADAELAMAAKVAGAGMARGSRGIMFVDALANAGDNRQSRFSVKSAAWPLR